MADASPFALVRLTALLIVAMSGPALAQPLAPGLRLSGDDPPKIDRPALNRRDPVIGNLLLLDEHAAGPAWTLPFDAFEMLGAFSPAVNDRDRRGLSFTIRRSHGIKGIARLRF
jgi:hypothetical protein